MYVIVWEFIIRAEYAGEFEAIYGPQGDWARLFTKGEGYRETKLLRDTSNPLRYITLDFWTSQAAYERFRSAHERDYMALDERCEQFTVKENQVGEFLRR
jgi:heme-degrading monooxygenase HmoA